MTVRRFARGVTTAVAGASLVTVAACSSSSSHSPSSGPNPTVAATADLHGHNAGGPNGIITAPASNPPSSGVPGGSEVFPHINRKADRGIYQHVLTMAGVAHVAYYPQFDQFQVYYSAGATDADRQAVYTYVTSHK